MDRLSGDEHAGASPVGPQGDRRDCDSDPDIIGIIETPEAVRLEPAVTPPPAIWARIEAKLRREGVIRG